MVMSAVWSYESGGLVGQISHNLSLRTIISMDLVLCSKVTQRVNALYLTQLDNQTVSCTDVFKAEWPENKTEDLTRTS